jgi:hypothetical protein
VTEPGDEPGDGEKRQTVPSGIPARVLVPTGRNGFGLTGWVEVDAEAAGQWDARCWSRQPPS